MVNSALNKEVCQLIYGLSGDDWPANFVGDPALTQGVIDKMLEKDFDFQCDYDEDGWQAYFYKREEYDGYNSTLIKNKATMGEAVCQAAVDAIKNELEDGERIVLKWPNGSDIHFKVHDEYIGYFPKEIEEDAKVSTEYISQIRKEMVEKTEAQIERMFMGRWSSTNPNPQSLPKDNALFKPQPDYRIIQAEYLTGSLEPKVSSFDFGSLEQKVLAARSLTRYEQDLPANPSPGQTYEHSDGTTWYAVDAYTWAEYTGTHWGGYNPTGVVIDLRNRRLNEAKEPAKTVQNSIVKSTPCHEWQHEWKDYVGLCETYKYCIKCDEKRK